MDFTGSVGGTLLLMLTPCLWYFYSRGALLDLYEGYIVFNAGYGADAVSFKEMCRNYSQWVKRDIMYPSMLMYIVGGAGVILSRMPAREKIYYTAAFLITCMGVQGNGKTHFNHYAQTLIPFAAVGYLVVARMIHVEEVVSRKWRRWLFPLVVAGVMACTFLNCVDFHAEAAPANGCPLLLFQIPVMNRRGRMLVQSLGGMPYGFTVSMVWCRPYARLRFALPTNRVQNGKGCVSIRKSAAER